MFRRWRWAAGAVLVAVTLGCGSDQKVTKPDKVPPPGSMSTAPSGSTGAANVGSDAGDFGGAKTP